jgi:hypothetical protein
LKDSNHHDFGHRINRFQFQGETGGPGVSERAVIADAKLTEKMKKKLGIVNPLDGLIVHPEECRCPVLGKGERFLSFGWMLMCL